MILTTTLSVDGYRVAQYLAVVRGIVVRSPTIRQGFFGGLSTVLGGTIPAYSQMCEQARKEAFDQMFDHARQHQADAIIGIAYESSEVAAGCTEVMCYGTAVKLEAVR